MRRALALTALCASAEALPRVIQTKDGPVEGKEDSVLDPKLTEFKGIPFAAPPVKENRFRLPQPAEKWTKTLHATKQKPQCTQIDLVKGAHLGQEDCLYLDVTVPKHCEESKPCPVMQWIYGGAWILGSDEEFGIYNPKELAKAYGVIVVAGNYRLDVMGWLAHAALKGENNGTLGNFGLHDQRAALQWTQDNIKAFGGDPNLATVFGESAGGWSVCQHLASPASSGLFSRAIIESGACDDQSLLVFNANDATAFGEVYATAVGCPSNSTTTPQQVADCLRGLTVGKLMTPYDDWFNPNWPSPLKGGLKEAAKLAPHNPKNIFHWLENTLAMTENVANGPVPNGTWPKPLPPLAPVAAWAAVVDGTDLGLPDTPLNRFLEDKAARSPTGEKVQVIHGTNHDEGVLFMIGLPLLFRNIGPEGYEGLLTDKDVDTIFDDLQNYRPNWPSDARDQLLAMYPKDDYPTTLGFGMNVQRVAAATREMLFTCSTRRAHRALQKNGHDVYSYQWTHHFEGWLNVSSCNNIVFLCGNYHASELWYVWQHPLHALDKHNREMTANIGTFWTNFAKTGDPNKGAKVSEVLEGYDDNDTPFWAKFNVSDQELYMQLQVPGLSLASNLWGEHCDLFDKLDGFQ